MDIVCSAVSVTVIGCCNAIEALTQDSIHVGSDEESGLMTVSFPQKLTHDGTLLMDAMVMTLDSISEAYGAFIEFHIEEV